MASHEPSDISEARDLLRKFERTKDHSERVRHFEDALDLLDSYQAEQDNSQVHLAANLRRTYTRKLLEELPTLNSLDIDDWFSYSVLLLTKLNKEADAICAEYKPLGIAFDAFIKIWANEAVALLQKRLAKA
jgi:hypothetical protein